MQTQEKKTAAESPGTISGCVTVDGKPAPNIQVALYTGNDFPDKKQAVATTDEKGCYQLQDIPANHYWLKILSPEYLNKDGKNLNLSLRRFNLASGAVVANVNFELVRGGVISGRITDKDGKAVADEPLSLTFVSLNESPIYYSQPLVMFQFKSDADGYYKIPGVQPGRYLLSVGEHIDRLTGDVYYKNDHFAAQGRVPKSVYYEQTYCPGVTDKASARIIEVSLGGDVEDINIAVGRLLSSYKASGRAVEAETGKPLANYSLRVTHISKRMITGVISEEKTDENGYFQINGLLSSKFSVSLDFPDDAPLFIKAVEFQIQEQDIENLELVAHRGLSISGLLQIEDSDKNTAEKLKDLKLGVFWIRGPKDSEFVARETNAKPDGSFQICGLLNGQAEFSLQSNYFNLLRVEYLTPQDNLEVLLADDSGKVKLPLNDADLKNLRVVAAYKGGSIKGQIIFKGGNLHPETVLNAYFSKSSKRSNWSTSRSVDVNGHFSIDGLEAGDYQIRIADSSHSSITLFKNVRVDKNSEAKISFVIDLSAEKKQN